MISVMMLRSMMRQPDVMLVNNLFVLRWASKLKRKLTTNKPSKEVTLTLSKKAMRVVIMFVMSYALAKATVILSSWFLVFIANTTAGGVRRIDVMMIHIWGYLDQTTTTNVVCRLSYDSASYSWLAYCL